jgi:hypothetical protein
MQVAEQEITKIICVESLKHGDLSTGSQLINEVKESSPLLASKYYDVDNREDFFHCLSEVADNANEYDGIILFIEVHGSENGIGIGNESVAWEELTNHLKSINENSLMGLIVVFSCCFGVYYFRQTSITGRAPYYVMFGVDESIYEQRLLKTNKILIDGFQNKKELNEIVSNCNNFLNVHDINLSYLEAGEMFVNAFDNYIKNECDPENLEAKTIDCYRLLKTTQKPPYLDYPDFKKMYIETILNRESNESKYNQIRDRFLMTDIQPELYERFHIDFDEMYEKTNMSLVLDSLFKSHCV